MANPAQTLRRWRIFSILLVIGLVAAVGPQAIRAQDSAIAEPAAEESAPARNPSWAVLVNQEMNLYQVTPNLYRCEQFKKAEVAELEKLGICTSINLRNFNSDTAELEGSSIKQVRVRINTWSIGDKKIVAALAAIRRAESEGPVVVHCQHGADRTGLVIAMYRVVYQGWTREAALDELENGGYGYHSIWTNIPKYLKNADAEKIREAVDQALAKDAVEAK